MALTITFLVDKTVVFIVPISGERKVPKQPPKRAGRRAKRLYHIWRERDGKSKELFRGFDRLVGMTRLMDFGDPVRDAMVYAERASGEFPSWPLPVLLRRLRIRYGLKRFELAARAGVAPSLVGRAEKGADVRVSTLVKLFAAVGCKPLILPAGGSYDLDWKQAHLDNDHIDWKRKAAPYLRPRREEPVEK